MSRIKTLISELSSDLAPVTAPRNINRLAAAWFLLGALFVVVATLLAGPIRPGALAQLGNHPRFLLETLLGVAAILWVSLSAFRASVPGALTRGFMLTGVALVGIWLAQYVIGFISPALEPSMLGKRGHCALETVLYALPMTLAGLFIVHRRYPLRPAQAGIFVGLAAGMLPALFMQIACMYEPTHIIGYHILPGLLVAVVGALIAAFWSRRRHPSGKH